MNFKTFLIFATILAAIGLPLALYIAPEKTISSPLNKQLEKVKNSIQPLKAKKVSVEQIMKTKRCRGCNLTEIDLSGLDLSGADFRNTDLSRANLTNTKFKDAKMSGARLNEANLKNADLDGVDLHDSELKNADLTHANLFNIRLDNADLTNANTAPG